MKRTSTEVGKIQIKMENENEMSKYMKFKLIIKFKRMNDMHIQFRIQKFVFKRKHRLQLEAIFELYEYAAAASTFYIRLF